MADGTRGRSGFVACIPARGGSKRIPRKNIKPFRGTAMIVRAINAARDAGIFDRIIVSTDDSEIAEISRGTGVAEVMDRPDRLADDFATTGDVMQHVAQELAQGDNVPSAMCCLYAAAPFVTGLDLRHAAETLQKGGAQSVCVPVVEYPHPIQRALRIDAEGRMTMFAPEQASTRSQDLEPAYHDTGQFYFAGLDFWLAGKPILGGHATAIVLPSWRVQDIDTPDDWRRAELLHAQLEEAERS